MSNHNYPRRLLDDAIDRAVQELVCAEPRPGLRRRVLDGLHAPPARRSWIPRLLVPVGAIAAVVMLAILLKPAPPSTPGAQPIPVAQAPTAAAPVVDTATQPPVALQRPASRIAPRSAPVTFSFGPPTRRVSATSVADPGAAVSIEPAGDEAAPAQRDAISRIAPIVIPSITIRPIEVKEIK
jgi:hypothetical protein